MIRGKSTMRTMTKLAMMLCLLMIGQNLFAQSLGTVTYEYTDQQGTPLAEADINGNIIATFDYTPYGTTTLGSSPNGLGYTAHVNDPETNLVYMQARYYEPETGRFLSVDPIDPVDGDVFNFNRYTYASNNPIRNIDPDGEASCDKDNQTNPSDPGCTSKEHQPTATPAQGIIGVIKGIENRTKNWPIVGADAGSPPVSASNSTQAKGMVLGTVVVNAAVMAATDGEGEVGGGSDAAAGDYVDLATSDRRTHILDGDPNNLKSGGHRFGTGRSGKSEFPATWSDNKIMHEISDVATDPASIRHMEGRHMIIRGTREGVDIQVVTKHGKIISGYPINTPRNP